MKSDNKKEFMGTKEKAINFFDSKLFAFKPKRAMNAKRNQR